MKTWICLGVLIPFFIHSAPLVQANPDLVPCHPQLTRQIDALLDYYRLYGEKDPLCQGERGRQRSRTLRQLKSMLQLPRNSGGLSWRRLTAGFTLRPFAPGPSIRLTRYAVFTVPGRSQSESGFRIPLLDLPPEEKFLDERKADALGKKLFRFRLTKQAILNGALPANQFRPLAWLSRTAFEEAMMQGGVQVEFKDGSRAHFNVSRSNGIPYKSGLLAENQQRYWFFKKVSGPLGYGMISEWQIPIFPLTALAGDLGHLGLGTIVLIDSPKGRILAILADTGGAFAGNTTQLDLFLGTMENRELYQRLNRSLPQGGQAFILE